MIRWFTEFDGLSRGEIFWRLFLLFYGPSFALALRQFALFAFWRTTDEMLTVLAWPATALGLAACVLVAFRDASRQGDANAPGVAVVAAIPFAGWLWYAMRRVPARVARTRLSAASRWRVWLDPFFREHHVLVTHLSPRECHERLEQRRMSLLRPRTWLARERDVPVQGRSSAKGFHLRRRHLMTRPGLLTEATGRYAADAARTRIELGVGVSRLDAIFVLLLFALFLGAAVLFQLAPTQRGAPDPRFWLFGPLIVLVVYLAVRTISRDDDLFLYDLLVRTLEAHVAA